MAPKADWRSSLGFTDRLTTIQSLTSAYQRASSSAAFAEAQMQAKRFESEAYEKASSKDEYEQMYQRAIDEAETAQSVAPMISSPSAPTPLDSPDVAAAAGETIGRYRSCLHHTDGLHSTIYRSQGDDGILVALKITTPHMMAAPHDSYREVQLLRTAAGPQVISLRETFNLPGGRLILVFPFMKYDLEVLLRRDMVTATQARSHLRDLFRALAHVHAMGIIHRDVKPSNVLLNSLDGPAYLADFGIAWKDGEQGCEPRDQKITDVGTTCYRAPEILFGFRQYGPALDLWAAGCVVAETIAVDHAQLFDAGPVGSDLSLIQSIFKSLGTPNEQTWPETTKLPDWGKVTFHDYPAKPWEKILKAVPSKGRDLVGQLVRYESSQRISAELALEHPYISTS